MNETGTEKTGSGVHGCVNFCKRGSEHQLWSLWPCTDGSQARALTLLRNDAEGDAETRVLDELHDVCVRHVDDGLAVHCQDPVSHFQFCTTICGTPIDDASDFMGHS